MAIFTMNKIVLAATALATLTSALPLAFAPRDVTSIQTETAYTTVDVPVTLWVDEKGNHLSTVGGEPGVFAPKPSEAPKVEPRQTGTTYIGDITHYDGGLGACGWSVNTETEMQIALPFGMMGEQSNGNPYCGKSLTIKNPNTGATAQATVGDKCMGCTGASIDLTNLLFNTIGGGCDGRCSGFEWWFN